MSGCRASQKELGAKGDKIESTEEIQGRSAEGLRQLNLCPQCGKEKDNGYKLCAECREYARSYYKRKRKLVVIKARMGWGYAMKAHRYYYCSELRALHLPPLNRGRRIALWGWLRARYASRKKEKMKQVCNK